MAGCGGAAPIVNRFPPVDPAFAAFVSLPPPPPPNVNIGAAVELTIDGD